MSLLESLIESIEEDIFVNNTDITSFNNEKKHISPIESKDNEKRCLLVIHQKMYLL